MQLGSHLDAVAAYIRDKKFDIVCLQEVAGGVFSANKQNCYEQLRKKTGLDGQLSIYIGAPHDVSSFIANATLYSRGFRVLANHVIWLKRYGEIQSLTTADIRKVPRCALSVLLEKSGQQLMVVNTHLAWGPTPDDAVYKRNQAEKLYRWMRSHVRAPFLLSGDFNLNPRTVIVERFSSLGINLTNRYRITNTLNPRTHRIQSLFPSGLPVDYIIIDKRIRVKKFRVEESVDLSDHLGLVLEYSI